MLHRPLALLLAVVLAPLAVVAPTAAPAPAVPPLDPRCLPLIAGTTGIIGLSGVLPVPSQQLSGSGTGGLGPAADGAVARGLPPDRVWVKDGRHAVSNAWVFALRDGDLYVAAANRRGVLAPGARWRALRLPACLAGRVAHVSADHRLLLVRTPDGQVYSHDMPGNDLSPERWTWRWGPFLWLGTGARVWRDVTVAAASELNGEETLTDTAGRRHAAIGVATYYLLRDRGRRITYLDPWLPSDRSREVCLPDDGTARVAGLDASGSTVLVATRDGGLHTRLYDFDVTGANPIFGSYTWRTGLPARDPRWQLPAPGWQRHDPPPGPITDRVTIVKTGRHTDDRELRVVGRRAGRTGVWVKPLTGTRWRFVAADVAPGRRLPMPGARTVTPDAVRFVGTAAGARLAVPRFHWACTPTALRVTVGGGTLRLRLWAYDALRQHTRAVGLDDVPRLYNAAVEVPPAVRRDATPTQRAWLARHLPARFTEAPVEVTATRLRFRLQCWRLTRDGRPARPDALALPDTGAVLADLRTLVDGGVPGRVC